MSAKKPGILSYQTTDVSSFEKVLACFQTGSFQFFFYLQTFDILYKIIFIALPICCSPNFHNKALSDLEIK